MLLFCQQQSGVAPAKMPAEFTADLLGSSWLAPLSFPLTLSVWAGHGQQCPRLLLLKPITHNRRFTAA